jgi:molybdenum cofactor biosynthesis enzyme MoaA
MMNQRAFKDEWRRRKSLEFDLARNSTASKSVEVDFWGKRVAVYANANLSIYSAQTCNAKCPFCVEELRPASRGVELEMQKKIESSDGRYFEALEAVLEAVRPISPSVSITGGEASKDPRLPRILRTLQAAKARKRTMTTNGSGLLDLREGQRNIEWIAETGLRHLNISRAHYEHGRNADIMRFKEGLRIEELRETVGIAHRAGCRVRLSCVLLKGEVDSLAEIRRYLDFAASVGVNNVIFRQLMKTDPRTSAPNFVVLYSDRKRVMLEPILDGISADRDFKFVTQIMGYYYYVEVWKYGEIDVVFEEADLAQLENTKRQGDTVVHELVFHPSARLCSTWQPWDGVLGPEAPGGARRMENAPAPPVVSCAAAT